jgi:archaellum component FlaC
MSDVSLEDIADLLGRVVDQLGFMSELMDGMNDRLARVEAAVNDLTNEVAVLDDADAAA